MGVNYYSIQLIAIIIAGTKINVFDIVATRAPKISDLRARNKFW